MRIIPKTARVKAEFFKGVTLLDVFIILFGLFLEVLVALSGLPVIPIVILMVVILGLFIVLFLPFDGKRLYLGIVNLVKFIFSVKHYSKDYKRANSNIDLFIPYKGFEDYYIVYENYYSSVLEISPREFSLLSEFKQNQYIDEGFGKVLRLVNGHTKASIVKLDRHLVYKDYIKQEEEKRKVLHELKVKGELSDVELLAREKVVSDRIKTYQRQE